MPDGYLLSTSGFARLFRLLLFAVPVARYLPKLHLHDGRAESVTI